MFDPDSRYVNIESATYRAADGREVPFKRRRFLPRGADLQTLTRVEVIEGQRLDQIAANTLGQADQCWQIADANDAMAYEEVEEAVGQRVRVPSPRFEIPEI